MDRSEINRALAKALAYKECGKDELAAIWAARLIIQLELGGILTIAAADKALEPLRAN